MCFACVSMCAYRNCMQERRVYTKDGKSNFYVLRFKAKAQKITKKLVHKYNAACRGEAPAAEEGDTTKQRLLNLIDICQSCHLVLYSNVDAADYPTSELNPANLSCTCKGFRMIGLCSHVICVTAVFVPEEYTSEYLQKLAAKLVEKPKRKAHRPKKTVGGTRIQPEDSSEDDVPDVLTVEELGGDLDGV